MAGVARKFGVHRRMARQAIKNAIPPSRKMPQRNSPVLDPVRDFIDQILIDDQKAPRKQRHTAHRIYERLCAEFSNHPIAERTVREYVQFWNLANGKARGEIFIPQAYDPGVQAQIDWYEAVAELAGEQVKLQFFTLRRMMIELLQLGRQCGYDRLRGALEEAIRIGSSDAAVVRLSVRRSWAPAHRKLTLNRVLAATFMLAA
jgi:hypothetical protein